METNNNELDFEALANAMPQIVLAARADGRIYFLSERWFQVTGLPVEAAPTLAERQKVLHPDDREGWDACWKAALADGRPYEIENRIWDVEKQEYRWYWTRGRPIAGNDGLVQRWLATSIDIHERKMAEVKLRESEQALRERERQLGLLFETGSIGDWTFDVQKNELTGHPTFWKIYGEKEALRSVPRSWLRDRWHAEDAANIESQIRALLERDVPLSREFRIVWPDGSVHWVNCRGVLIRDDQGKPVRVSGLLTDITKRKREEEKFRAVVEASPSAMVLVTRDGNIAFANSRTEELFGYQREELLGRPVEMLLASNDGLRPLAVAAASGNEIHGLRKDGAEMPVELGITPLQDWGVELISIMDIRERRKANELSQMLENMVAGVTEYAIFMLDTKGYILTWNDGAERIEGYKAEEIVGRHFSCFFQQNEIEAGRPARALEKALTTGKFAEEGWRVRRDGSRFLASVRITPVTDDRGRCYGYSLVTHDITEQRAAEEAIRKSEREFRLLADAIPHIVWMADAEGEPFYFKKRFYECVGFAVRPGTAHQANGRDWHRQLMHPDEAPKLMETWRSAVASGSRFEAEYRQWDQRDGYRWHLARALPLKDENGHITRWFGTSTDVHDKKTAIDRLEAEVQKRTSALFSSLEQLKHSEQTLLSSLAEKNVLLKEMHHRVRNNLQTICSLLSMQASQNEDNAVGALLRESERRVMSMSLIHNHLYVNEEMASIDFSEVIRKLIPTLLDSFLEPKVIDWHLNLLPLKLTVEQAIPCGLILNEFLSNALKYAYPNGDRGEIAIDLSADAKWARLTVRDRGVGLPANFDIELGQTLGLKIVQVLSKQISGKLEFESSQGATFSLRFPFEGSMADRRAERRGA